MIDTQRLAELLTEYKANFINTGWEEEKYKWEAIKTFQDNWDIDAEDFAEMLDKSLSGTGRLIRWKHYTAREMIVILAKDAPEDVRSMFKSLFDESVDLTERVEQFKKRADETRDKYRPTNNHYQNNRSVTTYLWLKYPDKYYIYNSEILCLLGVELKYEYKFKKDDSTNNIRHYIDFYDEICEYLKTDQKLTDLVKEHLTESCYSDPEYKTLTSDVAYYIGRTYFQRKEKKTADGWNDAIYVPKFTVEQWVEMIKDPKIFRQSNLEIMKRMKDFGRGATCTELSNKYGETKNFYNSGGSSLGKRIGKKVGYEKGGWSIPYLGKVAEKENDGAYMWKLRDELSEALDQVDLSNVKLYADGYPKDTAAEVVEDGETGAEMLNVEEPIHYDPYSKEDFLKDVFMDEKRYDRLVAVLKNKKNIIMQGAPGVGKTFAANRLAYSIMGEKDKSRVQFIQFHQNYSYEDLMLGYRPADDGFKLTHGTFYEFCTTASNTPDKDFYFIIDEINRGNISKIFGELMMLIEADHRGEEIKLASTGELFSVPKNLYIIGMMNTADRSLAMIDYALRRRFSFFWVEPAFDSKGFKNYQKSLDSEKFDRLIDTVIELNKDITTDTILGKGFCIGHSYFSNWKKKECTDEKIAQVIEFDILPMLEEYWFDENSKDNKYNGWVTKFSQLL